MFMNMCIWGDEGGRSTSAQDGRIQDNANLGNVYLNVVLIQYVLSSFEE